MTETLLFHDAFDYLARSQPARMCVDDGTRRLTFSTAAEEVGRIASALRSLGLIKGVRFGYLSANSADMWLMYLAASRLGAVIVPLNYRLAPLEWAQILNDSGARTLFVGRGYDAAVETVLDHLPAGTVLISFDGGLAGARSYTELIASSGAFVDPCDVTADDTFYQMYTSGTTGLPKGVIVTHANYAANLSQSLQMFDQLPVAGETALIVTPLYHAAAVWIAAFCTARGMSIILKPAFDPRDVVNTLDTANVSFTFLVPAMIQACLTEVADIANRDWSALRMLMYGASPIAEDVLRRAVATFGCDVYQAYGLTETTAILTLLGPDEHRRALAGEDHLLQSCGRALPGTEIRLDNVEGQAGVGEILARGPQIVGGYWNMPAASADLVRDGWLRTGDAGEVDAEGYLYIRDRLKDMVVSGGENIYPREVENVLFQHPRIVDAAVIGIPDARFGEALLAFVVSIDRAPIAADEIIAFCRSRLGGYKIPREIRQLDSLPRNGSGKLLKGELRLAHTVKQDGRRPE